MNLLSESSRMPEHSSACATENKKARRFCTKKTQGEVTAWAKHKTFSLCPPEDISCLQLHSRIPFPASFCSVNGGPTPLWVSGTQGGQWVSFRFAVVKKARCGWGPPPTSTLILHGCAFSHWLNQWQGDKRTRPPPFFFYPFLRTFRRLFKSTKQCEGKWPLTSPFLVLYLSF